MVLQCRATEGSLADKTTQLVLDALHRAVAAPEGLPLHSGKAGPGLFAVTGPARLAAQRCKDEGYLRVVRTETRGKAPVEVCALTEQGLAFLLAQASPKQVLEDLVRALETGQSQVAEFVATARQWQAGLDAFRGIAETALLHLRQHAANGTAGPPPSGNGTDTGLADVLAYLAQRQAAGASEDCPLPELFRHAQRETPGLTIGHFHDDLRRLHERGQIYLHPWTGPLYDLPEPAFALLVGHEIAYYASPRS
jgi:hypothetical protein